MNNVGVVFLDLCEELINNSVRVIERFTKRYIYGILNSSFQFVVQIYRRTRY